MALFLLLPAAMAAINPVVAADAQASSARPSAEIPRRVYFTPATPLDLIPVYSLDADSPDAMRGLEAELARLYTHSTSLPSGPDRRAFQTRIYNLEKRLRPLATQFDAKAWTELRSAVRLEWESVQADLIIAKPVVPVADAASSAPKDDRS